MNVKKDDEGNITLDSDLYSISFSFNRRQITPESEDEANRNQMISHGNAYKQEKASVNKWYGLKTYLNKKKVIYIYIYISIF